MNIELLAAKAVYRWQRQQRVPGETYPPDSKAWRNKDVELAKAHFDGFGEAVIAVGFCRTPEGLWLDIHDAVAQATALLGRRPAWNVMDSQGLRDWDAEVVRILVQAWTA